MGKVMRAFCWYQKGLYTCIKALKYIPGPGVRWAFTGPLVLWFNVGMKTVGDMASLIQDEMISKLSSATATSEDGVQCKFPIRYKTSQRPATDGRISHFTPSSTPPPCDFFINDSLPNARNKGTWKVHFVKLCFVKYNIHVFLIWDLFG